VHRAACLFTSQLSLVDPYSCTYPQRDNQAELIWVDGLPELAAVSHSKSTNNWTQRKDGKHEKNSPEFLQESLPPPKKTEFKWLWTPHCTVLVKVYKKFSFKSSKANDSYSCTPDTAARAARTYRPTFGYRRHVADRETAVDLSQYPIASTVHAAPKTYVIASLSKAIETKPVSRRTPSSLPLLSHFSPHRLFILTSIALLCHLDDFFHVD